MKITKIITILGVLIIMGITACDNNTIKSKDSSFMSISQTPSQPIVSASEQRPEVDPVFEVTFSHCQARYSGPKNITTFNLKSRYFLNILVDNYFDGARVYLDSFHFEYDKTFLNIDNFISEDSLASGYIPSNSFKYYVTPIKAIESTTINLLYQNSIHYTINVSISDLSIESNCLASKEYETSFDFERVTVFETYECFKEFRDVHKELTIKYEPNINSFEDNKYALLTLKRNELGNDPNFNCAFVYNGCLYFDILSSKDKRGERDSIGMNQKTILQLFIRFPKIIDSNVSSIWNSVVF